MSELFCDVALAVPLRNTFTYAVPDSVRESVQPGSRVLVPFRNKPMVGVVTELVRAAPANVKIRAISKLLEDTPALTPALLELGKWIAGYYLAPIGEVYRAMLPPVTELRSQQQVVITDAGKRVVDESDQTLSAEFLKKEIAFLTALVGEQARAGCYLRGEVQRKPR